MLTIQRPAPFARTSTASSAAPRAAAARVAQQVPIDAVDRSPRPRAPDAAGGTTVPFQMPKAICDFEQRMMWGHHHIEWHLARRWDLLDPRTLAWAKKQGFQRAARQEGEAGNGLDFLAMHHAMIAILEKKFPEHAALFAGWPSPPTGASDSFGPLPGSGGPFDANMLRAIDRLQNHLDTFASDDELGRYIETNLAPVAGNPGQRSSDATAGLHNYLHNRFSDPRSKIDVGDPTVNLQNQVFWRLHGWIEDRWQAFRKLKGLSDNEPGYQKAIKDAVDMMSHPMVMGGSRNPGGISEPIPSFVRKFLERSSAT